MKIRFHPCISSIILLYFIVEIFWWCWFGERWELLWDLTQWSCSQCESIINSSIHKCFQEVCFSQLNISCSHNIRDCDLLRILVWSLSYKSVVLKGNNEKHHFYVHTLATLPHWVADASSSAGLWQLSLKSFIIRKHIHQAPALPCLLNIIINTVSQLVNSGIKCIFSTQLKRGQEKTIISNENLELICGLRGFLWTPLICIILSMTQIVWNS